ncbi:DHH family phosphoesterase [Duganella sp. LX20W]|uniref:DHH family phosphoesterase n=2 Tax=Rugamonas brunnea TaxID=2758569 RepID=A0A7W2ESM4_9BURK|nr:DHH family phosphoesterase [Rugamonas brunnea]
MKPTIAPAARYDVFNGDADGICALHQLRLVRPADDAVLVTGVKRDIALLRQVPTGARHVVVLDISLDANTADLRRVLDGGATVDYYDHHAADDAFPHSGLRLHWDPTPDVCTSILVDRQLGGRHRRWAVVAAYGDNLMGVASALARGAGVREQGAAALAHLGQVINYNAYGDSEADLHLPPATLYRALAPYADPFQFIADSEEYRLLSAGYREDCQRLQAARPHWERSGGAVYLLPDAPWARRISGVLANRLAAQHPGASFAILGERADGSFVVSVRSGAPGAYSACDLCRRFDTGGGRMAAAGINRLPGAQLDRFIDAFRQHFELDGVACQAG